MTVQSTEIKTTEAPSRRGVRPQFISKRAVVTLAIWLLRLIAVAAVVGSFVGTYYGSRGQVATLSLGAYLATITTDPRGWALAIVLQALLTVGQWAARSQIVDLWKAKKGQRLLGWALLYLITLGVSLNFNIIAWHAPLARALANGHAAFLALVLLDILPEWLLVE